MARKIEKSVTKDRQKTQWTFSFRTRHPRTVKRMDKNCPQAKYPLAIPSRNPTFRPASCKTCILAFAAHFFCHRSTFAGDKHYPLHHSFVAGNDTCVVD